MVVAHVFVSMPLSDSPSILQIREFSSLKYWIILNFSNVFLSPMLLTPNRIKMIVTTFSHTHSHRGGREIDIMRGWLCHFLFFSFRFVSFLRVVSFHVHSYFSIGYVSASKIEHVVFWDSQIRMYAHHRKNTHANAGIGKAYPSNKWSRTNKKEWANAQQKHTIESFSSYACQMRNDTELDEHDTSTQRETRERERKQRANDRVRVRERERARGSWERQGGIVSGMRETTEGMRAKERQSVGVCVQ